MKKEYINPTTEIIMIETGQMMQQGSEISVHPSDDAEYAEDVNGPQLSRGRSVWDVDEEEW